MFLPDPMDKVIDELVQNARYDNAISRILKRMDELWEQYEEMRKEHQECIKRLQSACLHKVLREFPASDGKWGTYLGPSRRYCYVCGLAEDGPDFKLLTSVPVLTRPYDALNENLGVWPPLSR